MANVLGTPAVINAGGTYTAESGSNRILVIVTGNRTSDVSVNIVPTITAMSFGTASLANGKIVRAEDIAYGNGLNVRVGLWYIKEADIPAGAQTLTVTFSHPMQSTSKAAMYTLGDRDQNAPVDATITKAQASATVWQQSITVAANTVHIAAAIAPASGATATPDAGYTEVMDHTNGGAVRAYSSYRAVSAANAYQWGHTLSIALSGRIAIASFAPVIVAPSFLAGPTHTAAGTAGNTYSCTPDLGGDPNATWHIGVYTKGSPTPSVANVKAGTGTGFLAHVSKVITGADTQSTTGLTFPVHDVYHVLSKTGGDSALASDLNRFKAPPTGYQYAIFDVPLLSTSPFASVTPAIVDGDVLQIVAASPAGYTVTPSAEGDLEVSAGGDNSCQILACNIYDVSAGDFYYTGDSELALNDSPPQLNVPDIAPVFLPLDVAMTPVSLITLAAAFDPDGHAVTCEALDPLSNGLSISAGTTLGGTPGVREIRVSRIKFQDPFGASVISSLTQVIGPVRVPDLEGYSPQAAESTLASLGLLVAYEPETEFSFTIGAGLIVSQSPPPDTDADPGTTVTLTLSAGLFGIDSTKPLGLLMHSFHWTPNTDGTVDGEYPTGNKP